VLHAYDLDVLLAADLRRAFAAPSWVESARISRTSAVHFDPEYAVVEPVAYRVAGTRLQIDVEFEQDVWDDDEDVTTSRVQALFSPLGRRHRFRVARAGPDAYRPQGPPYTWEATLIPVVGRRRLGELQQAADEALALLNATASGRLTRTSALELLRSMRPYALIGHPEGPWLDVKRDQYDLTTTGGKVALCQAAARFANSELGGIVVVGMEAKKVPGGEEIRRLSPLPQDPACCGGTSPRSPSTRSLPRTAWTWSASTCPAACSSCCTCRPNPKSSSRFRSTARSWTAAPRVRSSALSADGASPRSRSPLLRFTRPSRQGEPYLGGDNYQPSRRRRMPFGRARPRPTPTPHWSRDRGKWWRLAQVPAVVRSTKTSVAEDIAPGAYCANPGRNASRGRSGAVGPQVSMRCECAHRPDLALPRALRRV